MNEDSRHNVDMGVDVGTTDLHLGTRCDDIFHCFYLELKTTEGELQQSQIDWNERFDKRFACSNAKRHVAYGLDEAKKAIDNWLQNLYAETTNNKEKYI
jgi:hypothetical protein